MLRLQVTFNGELASMDELPDRLRAIGSTNLRMRILSYKPDAFSLEVRVKLRHKMDPDEFIRQMSDLVDVRKIEVLD